MATGAWVIVTVDMMKRAMPASVVVAASADDTTTQEVLSAVIARVRGAVASSGRVPLSQLPDSVPPEARQHTLVLALDALVARAPKLAEFVGGESFKRQLEAAEGWVERAADGMNVTYPEDPEEAGSGPAWGDFEGEGSSTTARDDMTTD